VLRYCLSVAVLQRDSGLTFSRLKPAALGAVLRAAVAGVLALLGGVVAVYLGACYLVSGVPRARSLRAAAMRACVC
jgi:hypothetical protein